MGLNGEPLTVSTIEKFATGFRSIAELDLEDAQISDDLLAKLVRRPEFSRLKRLSLAKNPITPRGIAELAQGGSIAALKWLDLSVCRTIGPTGAAALIGQSALESLEFLDLSACDLSFGDLALALQAVSPRQCPIDVVLKQNHVNDGGVKAFVDCPALRGVSGLDLFFCKLSAGDAQALAASPHLVNLQKLEIGDTVIGNEGVAAILNAPWLPGVRELNLSVQHAGDDIADHLLRLDNGAIRKLEFRHNEIARRTGEALGRIRLPNLEELDLSYNPLGDEAIVPLISNVTLRNLRSLELRGETRGNLIPNQETAIAIAEASHLSSLKQLVIGGNIGDAGAKKIAADAAHLSSLRLLSLGGVTEDGHRALRRSPHLRNCVIHTYRVDWYNHGESIFTPEVPLD
jgi:hypothetical protein